MQLKARPQNTTKGERSVSDYLQAIQEIADQLAAAGQPIADEDLVLHMLCRLPSEYDAFATSIRVRSDAITAEDLHSLVLSEEVTVNERVRSVTQPDSSPHALYVSSSSKIFGKHIYINPNYKGKLQNYIPNFQYKGLSNSSSKQSHSRNFSPQSNSGSNPTSINSSSKPTCQICIKPGHTTIGWN